MSELNKSAARQSNGVGNIVLGGVVGAVAGLPLSYFLQSELVRAKFNIVQYTGAIFTESAAFSENGLYSAVFGGVILFGLVGAAAGFFLARNKK